MSLNDIWCRSPPKITKEFPITTVLCPSLAHGLRPTTILTLFVNGCRNFEHDSLPNSVNFPGCLLPAIGFPEYRKKTTNNVQRILHRLGWWFDIDISILIFFRNFKLLQHFTLLLQLLLFLLFLHHLSRTHRMVSTFKRFLFKDWWEFRAIWPVGATRLVMRKMTAICWSVPIVLDFLFWVGFLSVFYFW